MFTIKNNKMKNYKIQINYNQKVNFKVLKLKQSLKKFKIKIIQVNFK